MATWRPPKTSYWVTPPLKTPGGEDFQRIEENTEYLKTQTDGLKSGSIKAAKAGHADSATHASSAGKFIKGEVTLESYRPSPGAPVEYGSTIVTHNFGTTNIIVTLGFVQKSGGIVPGGKYEIIDANRIKITTIAEPPAGIRDTTVYVYTIFKP